MRDSEALSTPAMSDLAISVENVSKRYIIDHQRASGDALRHVIEGAMRAPLAWLRSNWQRKLRQEDFWALKDVSFQIKKGEVVGFIGSNGAGKSTLLKILSRITFPTGGRVCINGRIASLLEVGTGFHQELTGRENIFLNGAILGMTHTEITRKFDEIVEFSGVREFLDTPVKRYSSGMYVRLAFAVAAQLDPDILVVDEVLAVGDAEFRKKCVGKMGTFAGRGRTVLFVSHSMEAIRDLCQRCIWMKDGRLQQDGPADEVIKEYSISIAAGLSVSNPKIDYGLTIHKVVLRNERGEECDKFQPGDDLIVDIAYTTQRRIDRPAIALGVCGTKGSCFTANMLLDGHRPNFLKGAGQITCTFKSIPLLPQKYTVKMSVRSENAKDMIISYQDVASFSVDADLTEYGYKGEFVMFGPYSTPVVVPYEWQLPDGTLASVSLADPRNKTTDATARITSQIRPDLSHTVRD